MRIACTSDDASTEQRPHITAVLCDYALLAREDAAMDLPGIKGFGTSI